MYDIVTVFVRCSILDKQGHLNYLGIGVTNFVYTTRKIEFLTSISLDVKHVRKKDQEQSTCFFLFTVRMPS